MKYALTILLLAVTANQAWAAKEYPHRWFFITRGLANDADVAEIDKIVQRASAAGLNGMVLSGGEPTISLPELLWQRLFAAVP